MAETLLSFGVEKLCDLLASESKRFQGFDEQFNELKKDLNLLKSFLEDADAKSKNNAYKVVKTCVEEIKEIVFDAEDLVETFLLKKELGQTSGIKQRMKRLTCIIVDHRKFASDMGGIRKRISKVIHDMKSFGVQQMIVDSGKYSHAVQEIQREMRKTFPNNYENDLVGLEDNVTKLVDYLVEEENIQVVSITGMGSIGKTSLARQVFNHEMVKNHFNEVAWVCISQQFRRTYVWQTILQQLSSKDDEQIHSNMTEDQFQDKLYRRLETSNTLIVLDDMWKEEDWDRLKPVFPSKKGWKILLTSRNENVAFHVDPTCITIKPKCLTPDECWTLFQRTSFYRENATESKVDVEMEEMGKQMIKHCGGLPLAIKVLGGLLATQHTLGDWKRISRNIKFDIVGGTSFSDIIMSPVYKILYLSFKELPIYLKNCFLYLAHYPEDCKIVVEKLSYYWAAEGILRLRYYDGATIREVADGYIEELVKRNMGISERDIITSREILHLHDMMREVCLRKAEEENFVHIVDNANSQSPCKSRRIAVHRLDETYDLVGKMKILKLRSVLLLLVGDNMRWDISFTRLQISFTRLQLMRVLDLSFVKFEGGKLPSSIGKLIHLRYLSLHQADVTHLPSSMRNLKKMLYLNLYVKATLTIYMPNFVEELGELKYLSLPWHIQGKKKLELGNLVNLEMLGNFSTEYSSVEDLQQMTRLTTLEIILNSKGFATQTLSSSLSELRHLENLTIMDRANHEEGFVLDCRNLKQLTLDIYMPRLPDEQHFPSHLTTISLANCHLEEDPMPILEKLLQLKEVYLFYKSFSGRRMVCSGGGFPQLHKLVICLEEWEEWIVEEGSMPLLHILDIHNCKQLEELPDGLRLIYSLKKLCMTYMDEEWKERLSEGGVDYYKVKHILSYCLQSQIRIRLSAITDYMYTGKISFPMLKRWVD